MRFPLRLTADLTLAMAARALRADRHGPLILKLAPESVLSELPPPASVGRIVWMGGSEPLERTEIARYANSLAAAKRHVFLQTDGMLLRRRIHEFKPSWYLRFAVRFHGLEAAHDRLLGMAGAYRLALEAIRSAHRAGFLICALTVLHAPGEVEDLAKLHSELHALDLDGLLIAGTSHTPELQLAVARARRRLLSHRWARLSSLLDSVALPGPARPPAKAHTSQHAIETPQRSSEESVQAG